MISKEDIPLTVKFELANIFKISKTVSHETSFDSIMGLFPNRLFANFIK